MYLIVKITLIITIFTWIWQNFDNRCNFNFAFGDVCIVIDLLTIFDLLGN